MSAAMFDCHIKHDACWELLPTVVVQYMYIRTDGDHEWHYCMMQVRTLFLMWLPWILRMGRPGKKITRKTIVMNSRIKELELKERSSRSLLANVLDMDDDFRGTSGSIAYSQYRSQVTNRVAVPSFSSSRTYQIHGGTAGTGDTSHSTNMMTSNLQSSSFVSQQGGMATNEDGFSSFYCPQVGLL